MTRRNKFLCGAAIAIVTMTEGALAQQIVMRRPLEQVTEQFSWQAVQGAIVDGSGNPVNPATACGTFQQLRTVACVDEAGAVVSDAMCASSGPRPTTSVPITLTEGCTYSWNSTAWSPWNSTCSDDTFRTRTVTCRRSDGASVSGTFCSGNRPVAREDGPNLAGCTFSWDAGAWEDPGPSCNANEPQSRTVECRRSDGQVMPDSSCSSAGPKPPTNRFVADFSACTYNWQTSTWSAWSNTCSADANRTRSVTCRRSDGATVPDSNCGPSSGAGPRPTSSETTGVFSGCTFAWQTGAWQDPGASCTASETQTRTVQCRRSDGTIVGDSSCTTTKPAETQTVADFSGCSFDWQTGAWGAWNNTCSASASRTRSVTCRRSDGTTVADSSCNAGTRPTGSETTGVFSGCTFGWITGGWQDPGASCTATETQTRTVQCRRSDGTIVADSSCNAGTRPAASQVVSDFSGCTFGWITGGWSAWSSTCSTSATQSRSVQCRRSDGAIVSDANCPSGSRPASTQSSAIFSGCSFSATYGAWGSCVGGTRTRSLQTCSTSGGFTVSLNECTSRGIPLTQSQGCVPPQTVGRFCSNTSDGTGPGTFLGSYSVDNPSQSIGFLNTFYYPGSTNSRSLGFFPVTEFGAAGIYSANIGGNGPWVNTGARTLAARQQCINAGGTCIELTTVISSEFGTTISNQNNVRCFGGGSNPISTQFNDSFSSGGGDEITFEIQSLRIP